MFSIFARVGQTPPTNQGSVSYRPPSLVPPTPNCPERQCSFVTFRQEPHQCAEGSCLVPLVTVSPSRTASLPKKRVNVADSGPRHVSRVSSYHDKILCQRRGGDQSINTRNTIRDTEVPPSFGNNPIHANDTIPKFLTDSIQPIVERHGRQRVAPADLLHAAPKLADRQHAQEQLRRLAFSEPANDLGICPITFPKF